MTIGHHQADFLMYEQVLAQQPKDKNKIYSLHEPPVYCTAKSNIIVGVVSYSKNIHDNHTLQEVLDHIVQSRGEDVLKAVCDRGYQVDLSLGYVDKPKHWQG